jgi:hypothetical protein
MQGERKRRSSAALQNVAVIARVRLLLASWSAPVLRHFWSRVLNELVSMRSDETAPGVAATQRRGYNASPNEIIPYAPMRRNMNVVSGFITSPFISSSG